MQSDRLMESRSLTIGQLATIACTLEVAIPKPGNVHRSADFADTTFHDFLLSAIAIGPAFEQAAEWSLGKLVLTAAQDTREVCDRNTNLGMILLLAPLAIAAATGQQKPESLSVLVENTSGADCQMIYQAIGISRPGGLGSVDHFDVSNGTSPAHILQAMRLAESRDMVARQYANGFADVLDYVWPQIQAGLEAGETLSDSVIQTHLKTMNRFPDSLIARKNGTSVASQSAAMAGDVLSSGNVGDPQWLKAIGDFDFWLRADGNRRNPGTTADLIAAALFVGLCHDAIDLKRVFH